MRDTASATRGQIILGRSASASGPGVPCSAAGGAARTDGRSGAADGWAGAVPHTGCAVVEWLIDAARGLTASNEAQRSP